MEGLDLTEDGLKGSCIDREVTITAVTNAKAYFGSYLDRSSDLGHSAAADAVWPGAENVFASRKIDDDLL